MSQCHRKMYLASSSMLEPAALLGFSPLCSTTLGQTWQAIKWKKKNQLVPTPPVQKTINLLPANEKLAPHIGANRKTLQLRDPGQSLAAF